MLMLFSILWVHLTQATSVFKEPDFIVLDTIQWATDLIYLLLRITRVVILFGKRSWIPLQCSHSVYLEWSPGI